MKGLVRLAMVMLLLAGCAGMGKDRPPESTWRETEGYEEARNRISIDGFSLAFPADWELISSPRGEGRRILFGFRAPGGSLPQAEADSAELEGYIRHIPMDFTYSLSRVMDHFAENVLADSDVIEVEEDFPPLRILHTTAGDARRITCFVPKPAGVTVWEAITSTKEAEAVRDVLLGIIAAAEVCRPALSARTRGNLRFSSFDGRWRWVRDLEGGFLLGRESPEGTRFVAVRRCGAGAEEETARQAEEVREERLYVHNLEKPCRVQVFGSSDGKGKAEERYIYFSYKDTNYCMAVSAAGSTEEGGLRDVRELLDYNLSFD